MLPSHKTNHLITFEFVECGMGGKASIQSDVLMQIVDQRLLLSEVESTTEVSEENDMIQELGARGEARSKKNLSQMNAIAERFLLSIIEVGLACSVESPKDRMNVPKVFKELVSVKNASLGIRKPL